MNNGRMDSLPESISMHVHIVSPCCILSVFRGWHGLPG
jgi:hypothetical protein